MLEEETLAKIAVEVYDLTCRLRAQDSGFRLWGFFRSNPLHMSWRCDAESMEISRLNQKRGRKGHCRSPVVPCRLCLIDDNLEPLVPEPWARLPPPL